MPRPWYKGLAVYCTILIFARRRIHGLLRLFGCDGFVGLGFSVGITGTLFLDVFLKEFQPLTEVTHKLGDFSTTPKQDQHNRKND